MAQNDMSDLLPALELLEKEKGISKKVIFDALREAIHNACNKNFKNPAVAQNIRVDIDETKGTVRVLLKKDVVDAPQDDNLEIGIERAKAIDPNLEVGDKVEVEITPRNFGRIAAQNARQVVMQKLHEAERTMVYDEYKEKEREIVSGLIQRKEKKNVFVNLGHTEALLLPAEQIPETRLQKNRTDR